MITVRSRQFLTRSVPATRLAEKRPNVKGFDRAAHDGVVLDNCKSFGQRVSQYLFRIPIVVAVDCDAGDANLMETTSRRRSKWLLGNTVDLRLEPGLEVLKYKGGSTNRGCRRCLPAPPPRPSSNVSRFSPKSDKSRGGALCVSGAAPWDRSCSWRRGCSSLSNVYL